MGAAVSPLLPLASGNRPQGPWGLSQPQPPSKLATNLVGFYEWCLPWYFVVNISWKQTFKLLNTKSCSFQRWFSFFKWDEIPDCTSVFGEYLSGNNKNIYPTKWAKENHQLNQCRLVDLVGNILVTCRASQILICIERTPSYLFPESLLYSHLSNVLVCENEPRKLCLKQLLHPYLNRKYIFQPLISHGYVSL